MFDTSVGRSATKLAVGRQSDILPTAGGSPYFSGSVLCMKAA